jgi:hypothetical protein
MKKKVMVMKKTLAIFLTFCLSLSIYSSAFAAIGGTPDNNDRETTETVLDQKGNTKVTGSAGADAEIDAEIKDDGVDVGLGAKPKPTPQPEKPSKDKGGNKPKPKPETTPEPEPEPSTPPADPTTEIEIPNLAELTGHGDITCGFTSDFYNSDMTVTEAVFKENKDALNKAFLGLCNPKVTPDPIESEYTETVVGSGERTKVKTYYYEWTFTNKETGASFKRQTGSPSITLPFSEASAYHAKMVPWAQFEYWHWETETITHTVYAMTPDGKIDFAGEPTITYETVKKKVHERYNDEWDLQNKKEYDFTISIDDVGRDVTIPHGGEKTPNVIPSDNLVK